MEFLNFVMALSPIIVVLVGILGFRQSAKKVAPVALIWTLVLAFTYFNITGASFKENVAVYDALLWKGIKEGLKQYGQICSKTVGHVLPVPPWVTLSAPITPWPPAPPWTRSATKTRS